MSEDNGNSRKVRFRKGIALFLLLGFAIAIAGFLASESGRTRLLRLAQQLGLHQEEEHELVPVTDEGGNILYWTCTMHPSVRAAEPGTCPI